MTPGRNNQYGLASEHDEEPEVLYADRSNWRHFAVCQDVEPEVFFSGDKHTAWDICQACPVRGDCLTFALAQPQGDSCTALSGIWGGSTLKDRTRLRRLGITDGHDAAALLDMCRSTTGSHRLIERMPTQRRGSA